MSFQGLVPEALVQRSDSKDPATTCKGLTTSGRPCRRGLGATPSGSPGPSPGNSPRRSDANGVVAILNDGDAAAFFCWQHKDQAENLVARMKQHQGQTRVLPLQKRSSIDTLIEKIGILDIDAETLDPDPHHSRSSHRKSDGRRVKKRYTLPPEWQNIQGPLMSVPEEVVQQTMPIQSRPSRRSTPRQQQHGRSNVKASWSCCIRADDYNDDGPPPRRREREEHQRESSQSRAHAYASQSQQMQMREPPRWQSYDSRRDANGAARNNPPRVAQRATQNRSMASPNAHTSPPHSQTQSFLSLIPTHLDPATTSALLSELSKPFAKDDEAGYIYIFWLTPTSEDSTPDDDIASTILDGDLDYQDLRDSSPSRSGRTSLPTQSRRAQQLSRYASVKQKERTPPKILLKIGRAQNVHRRMTQWTKQCNQNITLVRYYPYYASDAAYSRSLGGAKVPHVNRVERLIHLELRGLGMDKEAEVCSECGRVHREWFEVPATRDGLRGVDRVVRRWVGWAEQLDEKGSADVDGRPRF